MIVDMQIIALALFGSLVGAAVAATAEACNEHTPCSSHFHFFQQKWPFAPVQEPAGLAMKLALIKMAK